MENLNPQDTVSSNAKPVVVFIPCTEWDERCVGTFTSNDGQGLAHVREITIMTTEE